MPVPWFVSRVVLPCLAVLSLPWVLPWVLAAVWAVVVFVWRPVAVVAVVYGVLWVRLEYEHETDGFVFVLWACLLLGLVGWLCVAWSAIFLWLFGLPGLVGWWCVLVGAVLLRFFGFWGG
jgi:hypothetical protein